MSEQKLTHAYFDTECCFWILCTGDEARSRYLAHFRITSSDIAARDNERWIKDELSSQRGIGGYADKEELERENKRLIDENKELLNKLNANQAIIDAWRLNGPNWKNGKRL